MKENIINIYIDESHHTGLLKISKNSDEILNYGTTDNPEQHRYFGFGFLVLTETGKEDLSEELMGSQTPDLKGSDLLIRKNNKELECVLSHLSKHKDNFYLIFNDKLFNLARDFLFYIIKNIIDLDELHEIISILATQLVRDKETKWELKVLNFFDKKEFEDNFLNFWKNYTFNYTRKNLSNPNIKIERAIEIFKNKLTIENIKLDPFDNDEVTSVHINNFSSIIDFLKDRNFVNINKKNKIIIWHDQNNFLESNIKRNQIMSEMKYLVYEIYNKNTEVFIQINFLDSKKEKIINFVDKFVSISTGLLSRNAKFFDEIPKYINYKELENIIKKENKWNYKELQSFYEKTLSLDRLQLYCSFDTTINLVSIFNVKINKIAQDWSLVYLATYINWYRNQFGTEPSIPINTISTDNIK